LLLLTLLYGRMIRQINAGFAPTDQLNQVRLCTRSQTSENA
jgi:hypothetical protein